MASRPRDDQHQDSGARGVLPLIKKLILDAVDIPALAPVLGC
jgi:hypothetical protein